MGAPFRHAMGRRKKWSDPELIAAVKKAHKTGESDDSVARRFSVSKSTIIKTIIYVEGQESAKLPTRRGQSNGSRLRELQTRRNGDYSEFLEIQMNIAKLFIVLDSLGIQNYCREDVDKYDAVELLDDLIRLGIWLDSQLLSIRDYVTDFDTITRIIKLRNTTGRTPAEIQAAEQLIRRLDRKILSSN